MGSAGREVEAHLLAPERAAGTNRRRVTELETSVLILSGQISSFLRNNRGDEPAAPMGSERRNQ